jgi:hypothetical protein
VLLDWFELTDIYLARGLVMYKRGKQKTHAFPFPPALPWMHGLSILQDAIKRTIDGQGSPKKVRITLSGSLCTAIAIPAPRDAMTWSDLQQLLPTSAATRTGVEAVNLRCELDVEGQPLGAAVHATLLSTLTDWVQAQGLTLTSVAPLWALASQCPAARQASVHAVAVREIDGTTLLFNHREQRYANHYPVDLGEISQADAAMRRQLVGLGVEQDTLLSLQFGDTQQDLAQATPRRWSGHWSVM